MMIDKKMKNQATDVDLQGERSVAHRCIPQKRMTKDRRLVKVSVSECNSSVKRAAGSVEGYTRGT